MIIWCSETSQEVNFPQSTRKALLTTESQHSIIEKSSKWGILVLQPTTWDSTMMLSTTREFKIHKQIKSILHLPKNTKTWCQWLRKWCLADKQLKQGTLWTLEQIYPSTRWSLRWCLHRFKSNGQCQQLTTMQVEEDLDSLKLAKWTPDLHFNTIIWVLLVMLHSEELSWVDLDPP